MSSPELEGLTETPATYFSERWDTSDDPWDHAGRWYEARKYDLTVAVLPKRRYRHALEPASGIGLLTQRLAQRADLVTATDRYAAAVAANRAVGRPGVSVAVADIRDGPSSSADLVVISEVLYYFDAVTVGVVLEKWRAACEPDGHMALVHHRPFSAHHVLTGDEVHAIAEDVLGRPSVTVVDPSFRLEVFAA